MIAKKRNIFLFGKKANAIPNEFRNSYEVLTSTRALHIQVTELHIKNSPENNNDKNQTARTIIGLNQKQIKFPLLEIPEKL